MKKILFISLASITGVCLGLMLYTLTIVPSHAPAPEIVQSDEKKQTPVPSDKPVRILFAGDAMMDWSVKDAINENGSDYPWEHISSFVQKSDIAVLNLESSVTTSKIAENKQFTFKSDPNSLDGISASGFNLVSLANNHSMDFGTKGLLDTFHHLNEHKLPYIGAGINEKEAYSSKTFDINGKRIKFLAFSKVLPDISWYAGSDKPGVASGYQLELMYSLVEKEKADADFLFVFIHWGNEKELHFNGEQQTIAHSLIDYGADGVIGSHPHVLQGFEYYKSKPIAYSLGNFLFPDYVSGESAETGMFELIIDNGEIRSFFHPMMITDNQIHFPSQSNTSVRLEKLANRSKNVSFQENQILAK